MPVLVRVTVSPVRDALVRARRAVWGVMAISAAINLLALTGSMYMLQIYDRVIPSRSVQTLIGLTIILVVFYVTYGLLDLIRTRIMSRVGLRFDRDLRDHVFSAAVRLPLLRPAGGDGVHPVRDLDQVRMFLGGNGPNALFDMPFMPVFFALVYLLHPWLGWLAIGGGLVLFGLTLLTEALSRQPTRAAASSGAVRQAFHDSSRRNAEAVSAMGMEKRLGQRFAEVNARHLTDVSKAARVGTGIGAITKVLRLLLQSLMLGLGAWLVIAGQASAGVMIAASILTSRALAPIEVAIANWRAFLSARQSLARLQKLLDALNDHPPAIDLPRPSSSIVVEALSVAPPGSKRPIIKNVSFSLSAGAGLGIIGPSGSGKSTLARALVGAWPALSSRGSVRIDGAALDQYDPATLGDAIGFLPQDGELLEGTIAENIARFDPRASSQSIIAAAKLAGVHNVILELADGYDTQIGPNGSPLSGGQRQRVSLARALYGDPFLVVLDEPNSNLDLPGDMALADAIKSIRRRGGIVVLVAHRPSALAGLDQVLVMMGGQMQSFGPKDEIMRKVVPPPTNVAVPPAGLPARQAS